MSASRRLGKIATLFLLLLLAPRNGRAADPMLRWRTVVTEHFRIHFYQRQEWLAKALAARAEQALWRLGPRLDHFPARPTHIVLADDVDFANGSATVLPYNLVRLFATPPAGDQLELAEFDDWMTLLVTHEYSHILHLENISGLPRLLNAILGLGMGTVYAPNQIQPRWFLEGLATYEESTVTGQGRLGSHVFDMWLRLAVLERKFQSLDQVTSGTYAFPHGQTAYLYGVFFLEYLTERFGPDLLGRLARQYGQGPLPFGLQRSLLRETGQDYDSLWQEFSLHLRERFEAQRRAIEAAGRTRETLLTRHGEGTAFPSSWPALGIGARSTGEILYLRQDGYSRPALMLVGADGQSAPRLLYEMEVGGKASPIPSGQAVITSETDSCRTYYFYNDLFWVDLATGRRRRLTRCARALDPAVSPDGRFVAFSANEAGGSGTNLAILPIEDPEQVRILVSNQGGARHVHTPAWSPDGRTLAYSEWKRGGWRDIVLVDVKTGTRRALTQDRALDVTPNFSPDGRFVLFSSDRTGVFNVFAYDLATDRLYQATNVLGGAFDPVVSGNQSTLVYQGFSAQGSDLHATAYDPASWKEAPPIVPARGAPPVPEEPPSVPMRVESYSPWSTVHPWRIANLATQPGSFGQQLVLALSGSDAVGIHSWQFRLEQGLEDRHETNVTVNYTWDRLWAPLQALFSHRTVRAGGLRVNGEDRPYAEEQWTGQLQASLPVVRRITHNVTLTLDYHYNHFGAADPLAIPLDPNQPIPRVPEHGALAGFGAGFFFSNVRRYLFSVAPQEGRTLGFHLNVDHEGLGGDFHAVDVTWNVAEFVPMPARRHVLMLSYAGGASQSNLLRRGVFVLGGFGANSPYSTMLLCALEVKSGAECAGGTPPLRGYVPGVLAGDQFHSFSSEYRFPIAEIERGISTLPVYLTRLVGAAYADYGLATFSSARLGDFKLGLGAEMGLNMTLGYTEGASLRVGYARGLMEGGENQIYVQFRLSELY